MLKHLMPREDRFFALFNAHVRHTVEGSEKLLALMQALNRSPDEARKLADEIDTIEHRADEITHQTVALLHSTFITPLDRDEIHQLISRLDDVIDTIQAASQMVSTYDLRSATPEAIRFAEIIRASAERVAQAVNLLSDMDNAKKIMAATRDIGTLEGEADEVLRTALSRLFREETDVRNLIKLKDMYEALETVTDHCDDVGNLLEAIILENS
ncbi:DUF47 domain-containing protein [Solimonas soli]|uniref:DUF47 domain-containing protein n=1 Tax=Solimonas soli TaxID=413479 RepID=UPI000481DA33|nr:DUF47 family protein [Solimonas soli]